MVLKNQVVFGPDVALSPPRRPTSKPLMAVALDQSRLAWVSPCWSLRFRAHQHLVAWVRE